MMNRYLFSTVLIASTAIMLCLFFMAWKKRNMSIARSFSLTMLAASFYSFGYAFEILSSTLREVKFWLRVEYIGIPFITAFWLIMIVKYTGNGKLQKNMTNHILLIIPVITLVLHYTNDFHRLFYKSISIKSDSFFTLTVLEKGPWYWVHTAYAYMCIAAGVLLLVNMYIKSVPLIRKQIIVMMTGAVVPWIFSVIYLFGSFEYELDIIPVGFAISGIVLSLGILRFKLLKLTPIALEKVFQSMSEGVVILDMDNNIVNYNPAAGKIFPALVSSYDHEHSTSNIFSNYPEIMQELELRGNSEKKLHITSKDGQSHYKLHISMIFEKRREIGKILVLNDITDSIQRQAELARTAEELEEMNRLKDKLFTIISHDIKSPLTILMDLTQLLASQEEIYQGENVQLIDEVSEQVGNTYSLVVNLLEWFKSQKSGIIINKKVFILCEAIGEVVKVLNKKAEQKGISIISEVEEDLMVYADRQIIELILRNLISNAIKYTPGGEIRIGAAMSQDGVTVYVKDSGIGMDEKKLQSLFSKTIISSTRGTAGEKGTGLGLSLCREFIQKSGGKLWAESTQGKGSTFFFTLQSADDSINTIYIN
ncbi:MAG: ATP-binding protein [Clostridia bacterium]|nr:ATP-binding protein [Clostridia bacterium]